MDKLEALKKIQGSNLHQRGELRQRYSLLKTDLDTFDTKPDNTRKEYILRGILAEMQEIEAVLSQSFDWETIEDITEDMLSNSMLGIPSKTLEEHLFATPLEYEQGTYEGMYCHRLRVGLWWSQWVEITKAIAFNDYSASVEFGPDDDDPGQVKIGLSIPVPLEQVKMTIPTHRG